MVKMPPAAESRRRSTQVPTDPHLQTVYRVLDCYARFRIEIQILQSMTFFFKIRNRYYIYILNVESLTTIKQLQ